MGSKLSSICRDLRDGAQGRNRTTDTVIFSHVLYQLSYLGLLGNRGQPKRFALIGGARKAVHRFHQAKTT